MNKLDKQIKKIIENNTDAVGCDLTEAISQIKQSILKAIMEKSKKRKKILKELLNKFNLRIDEHRLDELDQFESVIKDVLETKTNE